jgi:light-regulated signal transduction histidine kinase (bacteriophytochrome)
VVNCLGSAVLIILAMVFFKNLTLKNEEELYKKAQTIEATNKQLNETNKQLDFFTYSVSHDLKAPLRIIGAYSELLVKESGGKFIGDDKRYVDGISTNTRRMRNLIESLLMFSHSTKKELKIKETDIHQIATEVLSNHKSEIEKFGTEVILNALPKVQADPDLMGHVFENLVSNAIKYSHKKTHPKIEIGSSEDDQNITCYIKDNGEGFNMKEAGQLFKPFQRLHSSSEFEGSGIGLSIAKNIIQRHGGKIWVEAEEGGGATFYFSFPKSH